MGNGMGMEESFPTWGFPIPNPLNLLENGMRNGGKKF